MEQTQITKSDPDQKAQLSNLPPAPNVPTKSSSYQAVAPKKYRGMWILSTALALLVGLGLGYWYGHQMPSKPAAQTKAAEPSLQVPANATIVSQCEPGEGTQYIMPKDIPMGPIYNVWQNKVIGLEYMVGKDDLINLNKDIQNLPLMGVKFDHLNIGFISHGHAGFPAPHYHVTVFGIPDSQAAQITCPGSNDAMQHMHM